MLKHKSILEADEVAIAHQVNCQGKMGTGIAKVLYTRWPKVKSDYLSLFQNKFHESYLGHVQGVEVDGKVVFNCFSQNGYGRDGKKYTLYPYVNVCMNKLLVEMDKRDIDKVAIPAYYGCGNGGGDWGAVKGIIDSVLGDRVVYYILEK